MRSGWHGRSTTLTVALATVAALAVTVTAADLKPKTIAAFEQYQEAAERTIAADLDVGDRFLRTLRNSDTRAARDAQLRRGDVFVERLHVLANGKEIDVPDGLLHHWLGAVFVANTHVEQAVTLLQDYDRHAQLFKPNVVRSKTLEHSGDRYRLLLRFFFKKVISVTVNTESSAEFTRRGPDRVSSTIRSTRIAEVENPDSPSERELPVGHDGGFLWRLNTYWRFLERDGGTYVECESLTLTRGIPIGFGWMIGPFVTSIPRETLTMTLEATRKALRTP